jgi:hypothetical protein
MDWAQVPAAGRSAGTAAPADTGTEQAAAAAVVTAAAATAAAAAANKPAAAVAPAGQVLAVVVHADSGVLSERLVTSD